MTTSTPGPAALHDQLSEQVLQQIRDLTEPTERVFAVQAVLHNNSGFVSELASLTRESVREMKKTMSLAQIAAALGISRARAQQLAAGAE